MTADLLIQIEKRYPSGAVIRADLDLSQTGSPVTVLFGPSGAGKTTVLRCVAGLERPEQGLVRYGEEIWYNSGNGTCLSPQQRRVGFLFQEYALFPHLTVRRNLEYGLNSLGRSQRKQRVTELVDLFGLRGLEDQYPRQISGGQMQRVALARAVAPEPRLLLLDEPLSALDDATRGRLRGDLRALLIRVNIPTLLVTHDRTEAIALGDRIAVFGDGGIQQIGPVQEVFSRPSSRAVADSVGVETVLPGRILGSANGLLTVEVGTCQLVAVDAWEFESRDVRVCIRAEDVILEREAAGKGSARNHLVGRITSVIHEGPVVRVMLNCGFLLTALITKQSREDLSLEEGDKVIAVVKATSVHLILRGGL